MARRASPNPRWSLRRLDRCARSARRCARRRHTEQQLQRIIISPDRTTNVVFEVGQFALERFRLISSIPIFCMSTILTWQRRTQPRSHLLRNAARIVAICFIAPSGAKLACGERRRRCVATNFVEPGSGLGHTSAIAVHRMSKPDLKSPPGLDPTKRNRKVTPAIRRPVD